MSGAERRIPIFKALIENLGDNADTIERRVEPGEEILETVLDVVGPRAPADARINGFGDLRADVFADELSIRLLDFIRHSRLRGHDVLHSRSFAAIDTKHA